MVVDQYKHELNIRNNIDYVDFLVEKEKIDLDQGENLKQMLKGKKDDYDLAVAIIDGYLVLNIKEKFEKL